MWYGNVLKSCKILKTNGLKTGCYQFYSNIIAKKIISATKSKSKIKFVPYDRAYEKGFEEMPRRVPDITKVKKFINFKPQKNLDQIINELVLLYSERISKMRK